MTYEKELADLKKRGVRAQMIRTFDELRKVRDEFTIGHNGYKLPFLIVVGQNGTSKSWQFENTPEAKYINTAASPVGLYAAVFWCKASPGSKDEDQPVILDDVDGLLKLPGSTSLFKALGSDRTERTVCWDKQNTWLASSGVPQSYKTTSRLCILCNEMPKVSKDLQAVFDRSKIVVFSPTAQEIHRYLGTWWDRKHDDVYKFIGENIRFVYEPTIRWYTDARREKMLNNDWKKWLLDMWHDENPYLFVVGKIRTEMGTKSFNAQAEEFKRMTGLGRVSYHLYLKQYKDSQDGGHQVGYEAGVRAKKR